MQVYKLPDYIYRHFVSIPSLSALCRHARFSCRTTHWYRITDKAMVRQHFVTGVKAPQTGLRRSSYRSFILPHESYRTSSSPPKVCSFINSHHKTWLIDTHQHIMGTTMSIFHSHRLLSVPMWSWKPTLKFFTLLSRDSYNVSYFSALEQCNS